MTSVRLSSLIAPSFHEVHSDIKHDKHTHYWLKGGRGSTKSSFVSIEIITGIMNDPAANALAIRKVGQYLKDSVYEQLVWAISALGVDDYWTAKLSPLELIYVPTGQRIIFRGADKPKKLKSTKVSKGYIKYVWYEETDEFGSKEEIDNINQSILRGGPKFFVFYTFNPPKTQSNWVNTEVLEEKSDKLVHHSDYRSVPSEWLGEQFIIEAEHLKATKPLRYENEYLGAVTGTGAEIFTNITVRRISEEERKSFDHIRRGIDWGYGVDPFVYIALHYDSKHNRIYLYHEYYKCGAKFDSIAAAIKDENKLGHIVTAESAEPRSNDELRERGIRIVPAKKGQGSVEHGIKWLQNLEEIIIDPDSCPEATREFRQYEHEPDGHGGYREGYPDKDNHTIDAVRYALESDMAKRKAKTSTSKSKLGVY